MNTGRLCDVLISEFHAPKNREDLAAGISSFWYLEIWADTEAENIIRNIEGVTSVFSPSKSYYNVYLDHRYDREFLKKEIEARIKIGLE